MSDETSTIETITGYVVVWDNGNACGQLHGEWDRRDDAEAAGRDWCSAMCAMDHDPDEASRVYWWEVLETDAEVEVESIVPHGALDHRGMP